MIHKLVGTMLELGSEMASTEFAGTDIDAIVNPLLIGVSPTMVEVNDAFEALSNQVRARTCVENPELFRVIRPVETGEAVGLAQRTTSLVDV